MSPKLETTQSPSADNGKTNWNIAMQWNIFWQYNGTIDAHNKLDESQVIMLSERSPT